MVVRSAERTTHALRSVLRGVVRTRVRHEIVAQSRRPPAPTATSTHAADAAADADSDSVLVMLTMKRFNAADAAVLYELALRLIDCVSANKNYDEIFKTNSKETVTDCQLYFGLPHVTDAIKKRKINLLRKI